MGPILGAIIAAASSGLFSAAGTVMQNAYNSPRAQRRRLRKAGLPLAYMYEGKVNQQSDVPKLSIDPTLGSQAQQSLDIQRKSLDLRRDLGYAGLDLKKDLGYKGLDMNKYLADLRAQVAREGLGIQRSLANARIPQITAQTDYQELINELKKGERDWLLDLVSDGKGRLDTNQNILLGLNKKTKTYQSFIARNQKELSDITLSLEDKAFKSGLSYSLKQQELEKVKQQIKNLISQDALMGQLKSIREVEQIINAEFEKGINSMPDWLKTIYSIVLKIAKPSSTR